MKNFSIKKYIYFFFSVFLLVVLWTIFSTIKNNDLLFPNILDIIPAVVNILTDKTNILIIFTLLFKIIIVVLASLFFASLISLLYVIKKDTIFLFKPIIKILQTAPFVIVSVYIFYTLDSSVAPYLITFLVVFPIIVEGMTKSIDLISNDIMDELRLTNVCMTKKFIYVYLPLIYPNILIAIFQSLGLGIKIMIMAEYICQVENTIGQILINTKYNFEFNILLAWLIVIIIISLLLDFIVKFISKRKTLL